jgi:hypothetical protein
MFSLCGKQIYEHLGKMREENVNKHFFSREAEQTTKKLGILHFISTGIKFLCIFHTLQIRQSHAYPVHISENSIFHTFKLKNLDDVFENITSVLHSIPYGTN